MNQSPRFGGAVANSFVNVISTIDTNPLWNLTISDFGAMVGPRSLTELNQRGKLMAVETLRRELVGTLTNVFLAGWSGLALVKLLNMSRSNPKGVDFKAYLSANTLSEYEKILHTVLTEARGKSPQWIQRETLTRLLNLKSHDNMASMIKAGHTGKIQDADNLVKAILNGPSLMDLKAVPAIADENFLKGLSDKTLKSVEELHARPHLLQLPNLEVEVARQMHLRHAALTEEVNLAIAKASKYGNIAPSLRKQVTQSRTDLFRNKLRLEIAAEARQAEHVFEKVFSRFAIHHNQLTSEVTLLDKSGSVIKELGSRSLGGTMRDIRRFMQEFVNRGLADPHTGAISSHALDAQGIKQLRRFFFVDSSKLLPKLEDGLFRYVYKSKRFIVIPAVLFTMFVSMSFPKINNYWTSKKTGGKKIFPAEAHRSDISPDMRPSPSSFNARNQAPAFRATPLTPPRMMKPMSMHPAQHPMANVPFYPGFQPNRPVNGFQPGGQQ